MSIYSSLWNNHDLWYIDSVEKNMLELHVGIVNSLPVNEYELQPGCFPLETTSLSLYIYIYLALYGMHV